jgi:hypothetical protein
MRVVKYLRKVKIFVTQVISATNRADRKDPGINTVTAKSLATSLRGVGVVRVAAGVVTSVASGSPISITPRVGKRP